MFDSIGNKTTQERVVVLMAKRLLNNISLSLAVFALTLLLGVSASGYAAVADTTPPVVTAPAAIAVAATSVSGVVATVAQALASTLTAHDAALWQKSDGWSNGGMFQVGWRADHISFANGSLVLKLDNQPTCATTSVVCSNQAYASGEYKSLNTISHGRLTFRAKPAKGSGVVTGLFTYTGPSGTANHDEIDIEFLGKDTTKVQFNYFVGGVGGHEFLLTLGFDAALALHDYSIEWLPNAINWYVDGVLKHTVTAGAGVTLPSRPQNIFMNLWAATGVNAWTGPFVYTTPVSAKVSQVSYKPTATTTAFSSFLNGATATDNVGIVGDITNNIPVTLPVGATTVTFTATDAANNIGAATATITVSAYVLPDTIKPVITLLGNATVQIVQGATYSDAGATALDNVDGNITASITMNNPVNTSVIGTYIVTYDVRDAAGNASVQITRTVNVVVAAQYSMASYFALASSATGDERVYESSHGFMYFERSAGTIPAGSGAMIGPTVPASLIKRRDGSSRIVTFDATGYTEHGSSTTNLRQNYLLQNSSDKIFNYNFIAPPTSVDTTTAVDFLPTNLTIPSAMFPSIVDMAVQTVFTRNFARVTDVFSVNGSVIHHSYVHEVVSVDDNGGALFDLTNPSNPDYDAAFVNVWDIANGGSGVVHLKGLLKVTIQDTATDITIAPPWNVQPTKVIYYLSPGIGAVMSITNTFASNSHFDIFLM